MRRPITPSLLILCGGICLFAATGCSLFRSDVQDLVAEPTRHLPEFQAATPSGAEPAARDGAQIQNPAGVPVRPVSSSSIDATSTQASPSSNQPSSSQPSSSQPSSSQPSSSQPSANRPSSNQPLPLAAGPQPADAAAAKGAAEPNSCYVEIRALGKEPQRIRMSLKDANHVQKVLEQTGLVKRFRNMDIQLSRKLADGTRHKMEIRYDTKRNQVVSAFDYALHPNDLLVIRQNSATSFDDMLKKLAGPLAL